MRIAIPRARAVAFALAVCLSAFALPVRALDETYAIEINGVLCGYVELSETRIGEAEAAGIRIDEKIFAMLSALGSEFNTEVETVTYLDPTTDRVRSYAAHVRQGDIDIRQEVRVVGDRATFVSPPDEDERTVELPPGTILENPMRAPHLVRDLVLGGALSVTYPILDYREAEVQDTLYERVETATLELRGEPHEVLVVDRTNQVTGLKLRQWLDPRTGRALQTEIPGGRLIYLAEPAVKKRIELANLDATIATRTNVNIGDIQDIAFMKVRAVLEPTGLRLGPDDLNVPGQAFEGTVTGNLIEGVFTIEHRRYAGAGAPPFPQAAEDPALAPILAPFLAPEELIESDDPVLVAHARAVTAGAKDSWEAATRLSRWVSDAISYAIPGGMGARDTYDKRAGECGAHSLLLAGLCRAAGIPARVVWGCMYIPNFGGAFGQHAWTEVYMGAAGWIPVDATANEIDFVDSGHIRVGVYQSFSTAVNTKEMEVLEHRMLARDADADRAVLARLEPFAGEYAHPAGEAPFVVLVKNGGLAVDIPGQIVLALKDPDERGRWYAKMSPRLYVTFDRAEEGGVAALTIHEIVSMRRKADPEEVSDEVPAVLRDYLGTYRFAAVRADFVVIFEDGNIALIDPLEQVTVHFKDTDVPGVWIDEFDKNTISFERKDGAVQALLLDGANRFKRL